MIIREIMMEKEVCKDFEAFSVFFVCFCYVEAGDFLSFSRGRISGPIPKRKQPHFFPKPCLFFPIKKSKKKKKKKKNFFFFFFYFF